MQLIKFESRLAGDKELSFFEIKIVVRDENDEEEQILLANSDAKKYKEIICYNSIEDLEEDYQTLIDSPFQNRLSKIRYERNLNPLWHYDQDSGLFEFHEFISDNPIVRATLSYLKELFEGYKQSKTRFTLFSEIIRAMNTLDLHWD